MTSRRKENMGEIELLNRILDRIWEKGEVMESSMYDITTSRARIPPVLKSLCDSGILTYRRKEQGQKVPMYSFTEKGMFYYKVNRLANELMATKEEFDMESAEIVAIRENLQQHFDVDFGKREGD